MMDIFEEELLNYWRSLNDHGVRYIMVGGVAINLNGYNRTTDDIDVWIEDTIENREKYRQAFKEYSGIDLHMMDHLQVVPGWTDFALNNGFKLDLLFQMKGLEQYSFDECLRQSNIAEIDGVKVPFLHINFLIANKKAVNRPKDQTDVVYLEAIKKLTEKDDGK
jgi:predicted nucleotidyltransferase